MKLCSNCNKRNEDKAKFCFNCGLNFEKYHNKSTGRKEYCENCGAKLVANASFCIECGTKVEKVQNLPIVDTKVKKEKATLCINDKKGKTPEETYEELGFIVENGVLVKYIGRDKNVTVPNGINKIGDSAFYHCNVIESVVIPSNVKSLGNEVFKDCANLKSVQISDGIKEIPYGTFYNCSKLEKVNIPATVTKIGKFAFSLSRLLEFEVPITVTHIDQCGFSHCLRLKTIKVPKRCKCENNWLSSTPADIIYY